MIFQLDPFIVLQYISSSIDVIINLKFEDIEKKMVSTSNKSEHEEDMFANVEAVSLNSNGIKRKVIDRIKNLET
jgi:hypothetical protein